MELKLPLLVYDDQCSMCLRFKQGLERLDLNHEITYAPLSHVSLFTLFPQLNADDCQAKVHLVKADGSVVTGSDVITEVVRVIPGVGKLAWLLETEVGKSASAFFYEHVESIRKKLKDKDNDCGSCN